MRQIDMEISMGSVTDYEWVELEVDEVNCFSDPLEQLLAAEQEVDEASERNT